MVHIHGKGVDADLDTHTLQRTLGIALQPRGERWQHGPGPLQQDDPRVGGVHRPVVPWQHGVGELGNLADELDTGGPGPDHDEGEPVGPFLRVGGDLGHLELGEDAVAQVPGVLDRLHTGGELGEVVVAEIGVGGARGDHEGVVGQRERPGVRAVGVHGPALQVDVIDIGQQGAHVGFDANGAAQRGGDQTGRQDPRRHLVEQGLEEVVVGAVDQRHLEARAVESVDRVQAPEPAAHDDDLMAVSHCLPPRPVLLLYSMMVIYGPGRCAASTRRRSLRTQRRHAARVATVLGQSQSSRILEACSRLRGRKAKDQGPNLVVELAAAR